MHEQSHAYSERTNVQQDTRNNQQRLDSQVIKSQQIVYQQANITKSGIGSMIPSPVAPVGVADGGEVGRCQVDKHTRFEKGKDKVFEYGECSNIEKEPPDKPILKPLIQINTKNNNKNLSNTGNIPIDHQRDANLDEYKEPDSEDEYDVDTQSLGEGMEPGEEINTTDQIQKETLMQSSNIDEIREVTGQQGLSPRGRKLVKQNKLTSTSKPNTRARSRGV